MTATTGRTVLAFVAVLSLVLSLFAVARPVLADHGTGEHVSNVPAEGVSWDDEGQNANCPEEDLARLEEGQVLWHFVLTDPDADSGQLWIELEEDGILGPYSNEGNSQGTLQWFVITDGPDTLLDAWTDVTGGNLVLSHICNTIVEEGKIVFEKVDQNGQPLAGASFEVRDSTGAPVRDIDGAGALVCVDELPFGTYTVVETDAPYGYEKDVTEHTVTVDEIAECGESETPQFTFTNQQLFGSIVVHKTDADTQALVAGAVFDVTGPANGTMTEFADGIHCLDGLPFGEYSVTETTPPPNYHGDPDGPKTVTVSTESTCADSGRFDAPNEVFVNEEMLGSVLVHKTDADTDELVAGAVFTIKEAGSTEDGVPLTEVADGVHCIDGLSFGDYVVTETDEPEGYLPADPDFQNVTVGSESSCDEARIAGAADLVFKNEAEEGPTGSITINKEFEECVACEAFTPGYWFNRGGGGGVAWADEWLAANPQTIDGIGTFDSVADVQAYLDWDISGEDGENGLSMTGQLLRHYLALVLNVAFAEANDCDLASLEYEGTSVADWLAMALDALESNADDATKEEIKDALDAINNSDAGDGTLECPSEGTDGSAAGFTFTLWKDGVEVDSMTITEGSSVTFDGLEPGEYVITETAPEGLECTIVSAWLGDEELEVVDGQITVTISDESEETLHLTITVVNDCEQPGEEDEFGSVSIIKETNEEEPAESFSFEATWDEDGFILMDGDLEPSGDLVAGTEVTVTETLSQEQLDAGWSLDDIDCGDADVTVEGNSVTITVVANTTITCTFTNELDTDEQPEGELEIIKIFCNFPGEDDILVLGPAVEEPIESARIMGAEEEELPLEEGCTLGAPDEESDGATFLITGADDFELEVTTTWWEILTVELAPGSYVITELGTELSAEFEIVDGGDTAVIVWNFEEEQGEEEDQGRIKILKLACTGPEGVTFTVVPGDASSAPLPAGASSCAAADATFILDDGTEQSDPFTVGSDGIRLIPVDVGTYTLIETDPFDGESGDIVVTEGETTTVIVWNLTEADEGEQGGNPVNGGGQPSTGTSGTPREGTLGGNPTLSDTAMPFVGTSLPAIALALLMLGALGIGGYRAAVEARRRG